MIKPSIVTTSDIELAAALMTATNQKPIRIYPGNERVEFAFPANDITEAVTIKFKNKVLFQEVRQFVQHRSWLVSQSQDISRSGMGVSYGN